MSPWPSKSPPTSPTTAAWPSSASRSRITEYRVTLKSGFFSKSALTETQREQVAALLHDRMTESVVTDRAQAEEAGLFAELQQAALQTIAVLTGGKAALEQTDTEFGLALAADEMSTWSTPPPGSQRNPTDAELMMFAQANSEHCRHKIFNADFTIDGVAQDKSLFGMIRNTEQLNPRPHRW